jgi:hypothetical protein
MPVLRGQKQHVQSFSYNRKEVYEPSSEIVIDRSSHHAHFNDLLAAILWKKAHLPQHQVVFRLGPGEWIFNGSIALPGISLKGSGRGVTIIRLFKGAMSILVNPEISQDAETGIVLSDFSLYVEDSVSTILALGMAISGGATKTVLCHNVDLNLAVGAAASAYGFYNVANQVTLMLDNCSAIEGGAGTTGAAVYESGLACHIIGGGLYSGDNYVAVADGSQIYVRNFPITAGQSFNAINSGAVNWEWLQNTTRQLIARVTTDPVGHHHSQLFESDGGAVAMETDAAGNVTVEGTRNLSIAGGDLYIAGDEAGVKQRVTNVFQSGITDHFDGGSVSGFTWAAYAGFGTPTNIEATTYPSIALFHATNTNRSFGYVATSGTSIIARLSSTLDVRSGIRIDDASNSNYAEFFMEAPGFGSATLLRYRYAVGGAVTGPTTLFTLPLNVFLILQLNRQGTNWLGFYSTDIPQLGAAVVIPLNVAASRLGIYHENLTASGGPARATIVDWYKV